jgi:hypothetical protein
MVGWVAFDNVCGLSDRYQEFSSSQFSSLVRFSRLLPTNYKPRNAALRSFRIAPRAVCAGRNGLFNQQ